MKTQTELQQNLNDIINKINEYMDKLTDAMCNGNRYREQEYQEKIDYLEGRREVLEWVLH